MAVRIVQLGSARLAGEGTRIGTVRRPPRGVAKAQFGSRDFYDAWLPLLSPSPKLLSSALAATTAAHWQVFARKFRREMAAKDAARVLDLLAVLSKRADFSVGCYCKEESRCHRSILRELLAERGADIAN